MLKIRINFLLLLIITVYHSSFPKTLLVGKNETIKTLRQAFEICENGDILKIMKGSYLENNLILTKQISLLGIDFPIISGNKKEKILTVKANNVVISGIHFMDTGASFVKDNAAIKLDSVSNCLVENNKFTNNFFGI